VPQTILAVDDIPENLDVIRAAFASEYRVKVATDGLKALQVARSPDPPDLILLDVMMPGIDGFEVCRRLKSDPRTGHIPVIFVTALGDEKEEYRGLELGAVDYLQKPMNPLLARIRVRNHLALYDRRRELEYAVQMRTIELDRTRKQILKRLSVAAEFKDNETGNHIARMSQCSRLIARYAGLDEGLVEMIYHAAAMHDIGKIGIPDNVLLKPGKLTPEEWVIMQKHPALGAKIIGQHSDPLLRAAHEIALTHHEKWNGSGYPSGLAGEQIPLYGRIVAIADVFDALTSVRPYKKAWSEEDALAQILKDRVTHFDPDLVDAFVKGLPEYREFQLHFRDQIADEDLAM